MGHCEALLHENFVASILYALVRLNMPQQTRRARLIANFELSYNLSRNYPFKSFKWIALGSTIVALTVFSIFNIATNGYSLQPVVSLEPNVTEAQRAWFNNAIFTFGDDKLNPKCQNVEIGIGQQFLTSHQGTVYTVNGITGPCSRNARHRQCPSISYKAQVLDHCAVDSVEINLVKTDESASGANSRWWTYAPTTANAQAHCNISRPDGTYTIGFSSFFPGATKSFANFLAVEDYNTSASLWWGSRLMDNYLAGVKAVTARGGSSNSSVGTRNGHLVYTTNDVTSMKGRTLFNMDFFIYQKDGAIYNPSSVGHEDQQSYFNDPSFWLSPILTEGLFFAKMYYSFVLTDLGQTGSSNLLVDEKSLQYALNPDDNANRQPGGFLYDQKQFDWWRWSAISGPYVTSPTAQSSVPMSNAFTTFPKPVLGTGNQSTTIYSQYVCSVPQSKGISAVILIVLINDLVLISAAWTVLNFVATAYTTAADSTAMYCEGCIARKKGGPEDKIALLPLKSQPLSFTTKSSLPGGSSRGYDPLDGDDDATR